MSAANFKGEEAKTLHILQNIEFALTDEENPFSKAELLRSKMKEIHHAATINTISKESSLILLDKYFAQYCAIVDSTDPVHGLNNYAEVTLYFAEGKRNEYSKWTSGMTAESLRSNPRIGSLISKSKENKTKLEKEMTQILRHKLPEEIPRKFELDKRTSNAAIPTNSLKHGLDNTIQKQAQSGKFSSNQYKGVNRAKRKHEDDEDDISVSQNPPVPSTSHFRTARDQLITEALKKNGNPNINSVNLKYGLSKKSLGKPTSKFTSPLLQVEEKSSSKNISGFKMNDAKLCNIDPDMIEKIKNEIMDCGSSVTWDDIAGLEFAKKNIMEIVVWPMLRPDLFHGLRGPAKGLLLFGPPGTGKTLIGKCIACQSKATFFSISASSLTSKWIGEGEKMVRALFAVARCCQPSVVFIDEIDSLLTQRSDSEHESSRRLKTEFLVQFDGAATSQEDRILVIGATNRPQELDEAARRRLVKRLYIPLPEPEARKQIVVRLLLDQKHNLTEDELDDICRKTDGYSGSDMTNLCSEAAFGPLRCISSYEMNHISPDQVRHIAHQDFMDALHQVKASVSSKDLQIYNDWNDKFGSTSSRQN